MQLPPQVLAIDLDGTLISKPADFDNPICKDNLAALAALRAAGTRLLICTGRSESSARSLLARSGDPQLPDCDLILQNGTLVLEGGTGHVLISHLLNRDDARRALEVYRHHGAAAMLFEDHESGGACVYERRPTHRRMASYLDKRHKETPDPADLRLVANLDEHLTRDITALGSIDSAETCAAVMRDIIRLDMPECHVSMMQLVKRPDFTDGVFIEVFNRNVRKELAFGEYCRLKGFDPALCAAIGDGRNDLELIELVGLGIAMGNACDELKAAADHVAPPYDEGGFAVAARRTLLA
ncbi:MAG: HAD family phosphatase [bacterium]|nr:HAD family phosphatase [bacterium]